MRLLSTRDSRIAVTAAQAFLQGIAPGGGLFVPESFPRFSPEDIASLVPLPYERRVERVLGPYLIDYTAGEIAECAHAAYGTGFDGAPAPLRKLPGSHVLELWHGPTCAFKDMALQILPHLLTMARGKQGVTEEILILVATSGDTGKAALEGFADVPGTRVVVFYPEGGVSEAQRLQMVTQRGGNVHVAAVRGNFDDAQTGVKQLFADSDFAAEQKARGRMISSANSINFGRLVPQVAYYFSAYADMVGTGVIKLGDKINFVVPTGNFGNILAAWYALQMGLPVHRLICASNRNRVLADFFHTGRYDAKREFYLTTSPSMDILISSNLERLLFELCGRDASAVSRWMAELRGGGSYDIGPALLRDATQVFAGGYAEEDEVRSAIRRVFREEGYLMDTHTAVARAVYDRYVAETDDKTPSVIVSTASPYKFSRAVLEALGESAPGDDFACADRLEEISGVAQPGPLKGLQQLPVRHTTVCDIGQMRQTVESLTELGR